MKRKAINHEKKEEVREAPQVTNWKGKRNEGKSNERQKKEKNVMPLM